MVVVVPSWVTTCSTMKCLVDPAPYRVLHSQIVLYTGDSRKREEREREREPERERERERGREGKKEREEKGEKGRW